MTSAKNIRRVSHGGHRIRAVRYRGKKIWPRISADIAPWCGLIMESHLASLRDRGVICSTIPATVGTSMLGSEWENTCVAWVLMRPSSEFALSQGRRKAFSVMRTGSTVTVSSKSVKGKFITLSVDVPVVGPVAVKLTMSKQWYGYWIQAEVFNTAGVSVAKKDVGNGGGFTAGETAFVKGEITATQSGCGFYAYEIGSNIWWGNLKENGCLQHNMAAEVVKEKGPWLSSAFIPTDILSIAIYGGGQGGQGGGSYQGTSGVDGGMVIAPSGVIGGVLTPGAGSSGGWGGYRDGNEAAQASHTTFDSLSTAGQPMRAHVVGGVTIPNFGLGDGGGGGSRRRDDDSHGDRGGDGKNGGLVAVYQWKNN
ncbi:hypothetical protein FRC0477_00769 [Corynebacterium diphtheriae]|nr:hypothetical protein FRC0477_00769 [Corynebacterium diphtheriae]